MFKFKGKSPAEQFANMVKIWALLVVVTFAGCSLGVKLDAPYTAKVSHKAELQQAYSTMQKCGKHDSCEEFIGRFQLEESGKMYDREIDGFFYHSFVDKGRKPMDAYITLNLNDKGVESPMLNNFLMFLGLLCALIGIAGGLGLALGSIEVEYEQKDWEREQERKERDAKWRNV